MDLTQLPSPSPSAALHSAKLSALRNRLSLPHTFPLETLARCLVHPTADSNPRFNNSSLALLGADILGYYTAEHLLCHYPRLPMAVLFAAQNAYVGPRACAAIIHDWGVEAAAEPGGEVDPGYLQFKWSATEETKRKREVTYKWKSRDIHKNEASSGTTARVASDDQFEDSGRSANEEETRAWESSSPEDSAKDDTTPVDKIGEMLDTPTAAELPGDATPAATDLETASTSFLRALVGALALHAGRPSAVSFHNQHILSRHLDLASLFQFRFSTRDLSRLCAREGFEPPVARLLSETGRRSIAPVFVVGVYSGVDKLGEGAGGSLDEARNRAATNALRGWYLYRPVEVTKPSEVEGVEGKQRRWIANFIDCGEVVT